LRRTTQPIAPNPINIMVQVVGSGTDGVNIAQVSAPFAAVSKLVDAFEKLIVSFGNAIPFVVSGVLAAPYASKLPLTSS
jgi:hypothetical protein